MRHRQTKFTSAVLAASLASGLIISPAHAQENGESSDKHGLQGLLPIVFQNEQFLSAAGDLAGVSGMVAVIVVFGNRDAEGSAGSSDGEVRIPEVVAITTVTAGDVITAPSGENSAEQSPEPMKPAPTKPAPEEPIDLQSESAEPVLAAPVTVSPVIIDSDSGEESEPPSSSTRSAEESSTPEATETSTPEPSSTSSTSSASEAPTSEEDSMVIGIGEQVNAHRASLGLAPLNVDPELQEVAQNYADRSAANEKIIETPQGLYGGYFAKQLVTATPEEVVEFGRNEDKLVGLEIEDLEKVGVGVSYLGPTMYITVLTSY